MGICFLCLTLSTRFHPMDVMSMLPLATRAQIFSMICEGASMRSVSRLTGYEHHASDGRWHF